LVDWISLSLISALFLGLYDIAKKGAVRDNAVPPVLLLNVMTAAILWAIPVTVAYLSDFTSNTGSGIDWMRSLSKVDGTAHTMLFLKSVLVGSSWTCAFFALKHLPISIATPIRATSPLWTIVFAVLAMGERPGLLQWIGIALVLVAFFAFSRVGAKEGIRFHRDRAVALMVAATLLGSASALYDKYLLQSVRLDAVVVQAWFSLYLVPVMLPLTVRWWRRERRHNPFQWRWSIPLIAIFLLVADFAYFTALEDPDALLSIISPLRRVSMVIAFLFGIVRLKEQNWKAKAPCIAAILAGVFLLSQT
jgi:drug/metabolite transporter (DMT)-like permease